MSDPTPQSSLESLLGLLQLTDSLFPSGGFTHSYGLEQLVREGLIRRPEQVEAYVAAVLLQSAATADAVASTQAAQAAVTCDLAGILAADRALYRMKASAELRFAGLSTGRRLVEECAIHLEGWSLAAYAGALAQDRTLGLQPVAFGVVCGTMGVSTEDVAAALLFGAATALLQAAMRLLPLSHRDVQAVLHRLRPRIVAASSQTQAPGLFAFHPLQEIASMRHVRAEVRLFAS